MDNRPNKLYLNRLAMHAISSPIFGPVLRDVKYFEPGECYGFWDHYVKGFGSITSPPMRDLTSEDLTEKSRQRIQNVFPELMTNKKDRLLLKISGWPRIGYLKEVFKDAKIIHIIRDGRAVSNSFLNVNWWWGWQGPGNWRHGELPEVYLAEWNKHKRSFIALAGIEWKILLDAFALSVQQINTNDYLEIRYEDICENKMEAVDKILDFCELDASKTFTRALERFPVKNTNYKWKNDLSNRQAEILEDVLDSHLQRYGYKS